MQQKETLLHTPSWLEQKLEQLLPLWQEHGKKLLATTLLATLLLLFILSKTTSPSSGHLDKTSIDKELALLDTDTAPEAILSSVNLLFQNHEHEKPLYQGTIASAFLWAGATKQAAQTYQEILQRTPQQRTTHLTAFNDISLGMSLDTKQMSHENQTLLQELATLDKLSPLQERLYAHSLIRQTLLGGDQGKAALVKLQAAIDGPKKNLWEEVLALYSTSNAQLLPYIQQQ